MVVRVANVSDREQRIPKGTVVGSCEEVERMRVASSVVRQAQGADGSVPAHLQDLLSRSAMFLDYRQAERLAALLSSYLDVFLSGNFDLGRTTLVKHHINTGNSLPIKQPPQRIVPAKQQEMEKAVSEHIAQGVVKKSQSLGICCGFGEKEERHDEVLCRLLGS